MTGLTAVDRRQSEEAQPVSPGRRHVLFITDTFHGGLGGAEGALIRIVKYIPHERYRCSVITFASDQPSRDEGGSVPCPLHVFPMNRTYDWNALRMAWRLRRFIRDERVSIVHTFHETSDLWGGIVAKLSGCKVLISSRRDMGILRRPKHSMLYRRLAPIFDQVQTVSEQVREFAIREDGLEPSRVITIHNGIELDRFRAPVDLDALRRSLAAEGASHLIATVGNIRPVKGCDVLIRAAAIVCREFPRAAFLVIGNPHDPDHARHLEQLAGSLGVAPNVLFLGRRKDVPSLLRLCDVFCLLSRSEGLSNALLEAMAARLPAVATRVGGNPEVVEDLRSGFIVESEDAPAAAERILTLLRNREQARRMGQAGEHIVDTRFSARAMVERIVNQYDALLDRQG
jgi:glycosyltransferase involved in cell wall biosynthesis